MNQDQNISLDEINETATEIENATSNPNKAEKQVIESQKEQAKSMLERLGIVDNKERALFLTQKTPKSAIFSRKGKAGQTWNYVKGDYVKQVLNAVFSFQWDFELTPIKDGELYQMSSRQILVVGKLTIRDQNGVARIIKMGIGKKDVMYKKDTAGSPSAYPLDLGNDIKAAETDALKRCATGLGIGLDLYQGAK